MMNMMPMQAGMLMLVIMMGVDNIEDDAVNGDVDEDNSENDAINGDTDVYSFGSDNARTNNAGTDNSDDDIDATDADDGYSGSNDNGDLNDIYYQHEPDFLSIVVHSCLALDLYVFTGMNLLWELRAMSSRK